ncbi:S-layer protein SlpA [Clostridioides difficile]|nr:S-layer protein SlpA [Clostridioides difficile]
MNKKNLAVVMSAVTVIGSAAPVFAASEDTFPVGPSTVSSSKYSDIERILKKYVADGVKGITVNFFKKDGTSKGIAITDLKENEISYVKDEIKGLKSGEYANIVVPNKEGKLKVYTEADLEKLKSDAIVGIVAGATALPFVDQAGNEIDNSKIAVTKYDTNTSADVNTDAEGVLGVLKSSVTKSEYTPVGSNQITGTVKVTAELPASATDDGHLKLAYDGKTAAAITLDSDILSLDGSKTVYDFSKPYVEVNTTTGASEIKFKQTKELIEASNLKVIAAPEETVTVSGDAKEKAQDLAKKYVFNDTEVGQAYTDVTGADFDKADGDYYQVVLYPEGKRLQTKSTYAASNYKPELPSNREDTPAIVILRSTNKNNLKTALDELRTANNNYSNTSELSGDDRIETAIAISKDSYNAEKNINNDADYTEVDNIVLVGAQSIVDGLVASPLAAVKNGPLLLTSKDKLDSSVKSEIKRVMGLDDKTGITAKKTVYIAGGVNSVSKEVANELSDMGLKVERLSGDDRYSTSLEIADEIGLDNDKAFVVGGTGLADAMSIASIAANKEMPIVVVDGKAKELSKEAEDFLGNADVDIIGGKASVSEDMEESIEDAIGKSPERINGDDRQDTNAEVIKNYFKKGDSDAIGAGNGVINFYVAKDGSTKEDQLVDALAVASVAAHKDAPIILATDNLSSEQSVAISKVVRDNVSKSLTKVGKGIADSVVKKIKDLLEM